ncbi:3'(2'),5'-bisphosphate nucleotidase CysQ family protein [Acidisoma cladoniae]|jgi:3'(2'), 5'-bisphosphate nucleotidase|uniref:3'(2'),5'-bisphosphate nucleotidase CysQ family protein n=1 Tax=Acidisoma cladoniae TaxID=3040935 RepID=UPI002550B8DC|nr:3'(2'),5'-bisphosphate nucleotidase CysQ [Acidisoma sp. PAMC 29798]
MPDRDVYHARMKTRYSDEALLQLAVQLATDAGTLILGLRARGFSVTAKADRSLVTDADNAAEVFILDGLRRADPQVPVIAEEESAAGISPDAEHEFWLVDPLDGTRDFAAGLDDFAVNVGLVRHGRPVLGAVGVPARGAVYFGMAGQAFRRDLHGETRIEARSPPPEGLTLLVSRFHGDTMPALPPGLESHAIAHVTRMGSAAKFCRVAEGSGDLYPRRGRTMEWDTAAPQAVVEAAGGALRRLDDDTVLTYGKPGWENPGFYCRGK